MIIGQLHLVFSQEHSDGHLPPNPAFLHSDSAGQRSSRKGEGRHHADFRVGRSANHLDDPLSRVHLAKEQGLVLGRVISDREDFPGHHVVQKPSQRILGLDLQSGHGQQVGQIVNGHLDVHELFQPVETYAHEKTRFALLIFWNVGMMESWNDESKGHHIFPLETADPCALSTHYSILPPFHYSSI